MATIKIKRVYEEPSETDGYGILVDRLWPRGIKKENAGVDLWMKEIGPSDELRKWFNHDESKWQEFSERFKEELKTGAAFKELKKIIKEHPTVTLVYGAKDEKHNRAVVLQGLLKD